jgi:hypothetical protein|tara:strand:- start:467 stop:1039 length:573 start_codon:yes stop_codon:yes gene_type:complete
MNNYRNTMKPILLLILFMVIVSACSVETPEQEIQKDIEMVGGIVTMKLTSPSFENNQEIPSEFTCDGPNILPELNIEETPENTKSLALIMDDPDAPGGTWVHWVVWNIPPKTNVIQKGTEPQGIQGKTSFGRFEYGGPCPPSGTHRYFFKLYALDATLDLKEGSDKTALEQAMDGHIIESSELIGNYKRE